MSVDRLAELTRNVPHEVCEPAASRVVMVVVDPFPAEYLAEVRHATEQLKVASDAVLTAKTAQETKAYLQLVERASLAATTHLGLLKVALEDRRLSPDQKAFRTEQLRRLTTQYYTQFGEFNDRVAKRNAHPGP